MYLIVVAHRRYHAKPPPIPTPTLLATLRICQNTVALGPMAPKDLLIEIQVKNSIGICKNGIKKDVLIYEKEFSFQYKCKSAKLFIHFASLSFFFLCSSGVAASSFLLFHLIFSSRYVLFALAS